MCSKGGGSPPVPSSQSTAFQSATAPSADVKPMYLDYLNAAKGLSGTAFNTGMLGSAAPMDPLQQQAGAALFQRGMDLGTFDPAGVRAIESPYTEDVVNATQNWFNNQNAIQANDLMSGAIRSGNAFGGDRAGVAAGVLAGQQQLAQAPVIGGLRQAGYTQALNEWNQLQQMGMTGAGAALGWGGQLQQQKQRELDVAQQNAMMQSAYPFQLQNWYGSALGSLGPLLGSFSQGYTTPPEPSALQQGVGIASSLVGLAGKLFGGKHGGAVPYRARGGLVPIVVSRRARGGPILDFRMARGGLVPVYAYGGEVDDFNQDLSDLTGQRPDDEDRRPQEGRPSFQRQFDIGGLHIPVRPNPYESAQRTMQEQMRAERERQAQAQQKGQQQDNSTAGTIGSLAGLAIKAAPLLMMMSDRKTKTDVQRVGKTDDGEGLYAFRYRGDPKTYPKVVGPMAHKQRGGLVQGFQGGGGLRTMRMGPLPGEEGGFPEEPPEPPTVLRPAPGLLPFPVNPAPGYVAPPAVTPPPPADGASTWRIPPIVSPAGAAEAPAAPAAPAAAPANGDTEAETETETDDDDDETAVYVATPPGETGAVPLPQPRPGLSGPPPGTPAPGINPNQQVAGVRTQPLGGAPAAVAAPNGGDSGGGGYPRTQVIPELGGPRQPWGRGVFDAMIGFGAGLTSRPNWYGGIGAGALAASGAMDRARREELLDAKPQYLGDGRWRSGNKIIDTGLRKPQTAAQKGEETQAQRLKREQDERHFQQKEERLKGARPSAREEGIDRRFHTKQLQSALKGVDDPAEVAKIIQTYNQRWGTNFNVPELPPADAPAAVKEGWFSSLWKSLFGSSEAAPATAAPAAPAEPGAAPDAPTARSQAQPAPAEAPASAPAAPANPIQDALKGGMSKDQVKEQARKALAGGKNRKMIFDQLKGAGVDFGDLIKQFPIQ